MKKVLLTPFVKEDIVNVQWEAPPFPYDLQTVERKIQTLKGDESPQIDLLEFGWLDVESESGWKVSQKKRRKERRTKFIF
jgi:hypothetical protein